MSGVRDQRVYDPAGHAMLFYILKACLHLALSCGWSHKPCDLHQCDFYKQDLAWKLKQTDEHIKCGANHVDP